jgi:hypothetical protein
MFSGSGFSDEEVDQEEHEMGEYHEENDNLPTFRQVVLPCAQYNNLWESLVYDDTVKQDLLDYIEASLLFADRSVDKQLVAWNRMILFHGKT